MKYVLGVDSGGTKYLIKAADLSGHVLAEHIGQPASHYKAGVDEAYRRIADSVHSCLAAFGGRAENCAAITVGTTGMDAAEDEALIRGIYRRLEGFDCPIQVVNDAEVAHHAVTGGEGVVVIVGTGSIAYGRDSAGNTWRVGGWPPIIGGDEGSGTWLLCRALEHVSRVIDGRLEPTALSELLGERLNIHTPGQLIGVCQQIERGTFQNPGVGLWINQLANDGDALCCELLTRGGLQAADLVRGVVRKLSFPENFVIGAWGSAIIKSAVQFGAFRQSLLRDYPAAKIRIADRDAADGAIDMALAQLE